MSSSTPSTDSIAVPAEYWRASLAQQLAPDEKIAAWLETDLDTGLHFNQTMLVVTDCALYAQNPEKSQWLRWPYRAGLTLSHHDHGGVATLELHDASCRLAYWRYTVGLSIAAQRLIDQFQR